MKVALSHIASVQGELDEYVNELSGRLLNAGHEVHLFYTSWKNGGLDPRLTLHKVPGPLRRLGASNEEWLGRRIQQVECDVVHSFEGSASRDVHTTANGISSPYELSEADLKALATVVDTDRFQPSNRESLRNEWRERVVIPQDCFVVLCAGDGFGQLGAETLIEAARVVKERGGLTGEQTLRIVFIGDETQRVEQSLSELAKSKGVWRTVKLYGPQERPECWHAMADLYVQPAAGGDAGGVLQAMATGLPVVLARDSALAKLIDSGTNGVLLNGETDPSAIAKAVADRIFEFAQDEARGRQIGAAARETSEEHSWTRHVEQLTALYERVAVLKQAAG